MDIQSLYKVFLDAGKQPCKRGDPDTANKMHRYNAARSALFSALRDAYEKGDIFSSAADEIISAMSAANRNPEEFWGSSKFAVANHTVFLRDKERRLFEELLQSWLSQKGGDAT